MFIDNYVYSTLQRLMGRQFIRRGFVDEIDLLGTAEDNVNRFAPAVKVILAEGQSWISDWLPLLSGKYDIGGAEYLPPDIGAQVMLICPGGAPGQMVVAGFIEGMPAEAGSSQEDRNNRSVFAFGSSAERRVVVTVDRKDGDESYTVKTPNGHTVILKDKVGAQGIVVQTAAGHYVILRDDASENRLYVHHSGGTEVVFNENGDWTARVIHDQVETIGNDRDTTVVNDSQETIGGDETKIIGGTLTYEATGDVVIKSNANATLHGDIMAALETALGALAGIQQAMTHPVCYLTGAVIGASTTAKASP